MEKKYLDVQDFTLFDFTNEALKEYIPLLNVEGKKVLTVVGSGDQALNLIAMGASRVDTFDINPKAKEYMILKACAILELSYEEFFEYMVQEEKSIIDFESFYKRIRDYLPEDTRQYWDLKYQEKQCIYYRAILSEPHFENNLYSTEEGYEDLKKKLSLSKISFISSHLLNLHHKLPENSKYQAILCSNISSYLPISERKLRSYLRKKMFPHLEHQGIIQCAYYYNSGVPVYFFLKNRKSIQFIPVSPSLLVGDHDCVCFMKKLK